MTQAMQVGNWFLLPKMATVPLICFFGSDREIARNRAAPIVPGSKLVSLDGALDG